MFSISNDWLVRTMSTFIGKVSWRFSQNVCNYNRSLLIYSSVRVAWYLVECFGFGCFKHEELYLIFVYSNFAFTTTQINANQFPTNGQSIARYMIMMIMILVFLFLVTEYYLCDMNVDVLLAKSKRKQRTKMKFRTMKMYTDLCFSLRWWYIYIQM